MHSAEFLQEMNQKLLTMQKQFESEISAVTQKDPQHPAEGADTSEDDVSEKVSAYADEVSLMGELEAQLRDVQKALEAIAKGTYGICKYCNQDIDMKRLEARPSSSSCISCKKLFTQEL